MFAFAVSFALACQSPAPPAPLFRAEADPVAREAFPYERFTVTDTLGRRVQFYLSKAPAGAEPLPLALAVQGSGSQSVFVEIDTASGKRIGSGGPEAALLRVARDKLRVLVVEKPGVEFLVQPSRPGAAEEGSLEFRREHTLPRWVEALQAGIEAAVQLPGVAAGGVLAVGHSEGGHVVCNLAARNPRVTHVASLAGGGPTQLYDLIALAREGQFGPPDLDGAARVAWLRREWDKVLAAPEAEDRFFAGHPHRRWTSFARAPAIPSLLQSQAAVFLAQGTADRAVAVSAVDMLYAELIARGRAVVYERIDGADHGLCQSDDGERKGWLDVHRKVVEWFLAGR